MGLATMDPSPAKVTVEGPDGSIGVSGGLGPWRGR